MIFHRSAAIPYYFLFTWLFSGDCTCCITEQYFNENILAYYLNTFDGSNSSSQPLIYKYDINTDCPENLTHWGFDFKIYAPEVGFTTFETFYSGKIEISSESPVTYFTNLDISSGSGPIIENNAQAETLISYISQSGKLPNGKYLFQFSLHNNSEILDAVSTIIDIESPVTLELFSPGGELSEISNTYTYSTIPLFTWYSDFCSQCEYGIRVSEYDQEKHGSLEDALTGWSLVPMDQSEDYFNLGWNANSFQYPPGGHIDLEVGKYYTWQIRRSFDTTVDIQYDYSPIYVFEVRAPDKLQLDYSNPYLAVIESIIGEEQFYLWFSPGGELERFTPSGEAIWINNEEIHIDGLYSILSDLNQGKISIESIKIK